MPGGVTSFSHTINAMSLAFVEKVKRVGCPSSIRDIVYSFQKI